MPNSVARLSHTNTGYTDFSEKKTDSATVNIPIPTAFAVPSAPLFPAERAMAVIPENPTEPSDYWITSGNLERAGLGFLASLSATAGVAASYFSPVIAGTIGATGAALLPFGFAAGTIAWLTSAYLTRNYDSSAEVAKYRQECANFSLEQAFAKHGKYVWERKLLSESEVVEKFLAAQNMLANVPAAEEHFRNTSMLLAATGFTLPSPRETAQNRFQTECFSLTLEEAITLHGLEAIFSWQLYSPEDFLKRYAEHENDLRSLDKIQQFYKKAEAVRRQLDFLNLYEIPSPERLLKKLREECANMSYEEIVTMHSLECVFSSNLLTPEEFKTKYEEYTKKLFRNFGIQRLINDYKKTLKTRIETYANNIFYEIPHPKNFKNIWVKTTKNYPFERILGECDISDLIKYEIVEDSVYADCLKTLESTFGALKAKEKTDILNIENEHSLTVRQAKNGLNRALETARIAKNAIESARDERARKIAILRADFEEAERAGNFELANRIGERINTERSWGALDYFNEWSQKTKIDQNIDLAKKQYAQTVTLADNTKKMALELVRERLENALRSLEAEHRVARSHVKN